MFELLPGTGLVLPHGVGVLRFGMSEREAQWVVAALADVRETWVCQTDWAFSACYEGLELLVWGDTTDRLGRAGYDRQGCATAVLHRHERRPTTPSAVPVVLDGVDVFGYPAAEVMAALGADLHPALRFPRVQSPGAYLADVSVSAM